MVVGLDANHLTMCKFGGEQDALYEKVAGRLKAEVSAMGTVDGVADHEKRVRNLFESVPSVPMTEQ
jgi:hypothetical protein